MNITRLKSVMVLHGDTQEDLAEFLGVNPTTLSLRFTMKREFKQTEIEAIAKRYHLTPKDVCDIFFKGGEDQ